MRFPVATRYSDYDSKGHVNNAVYLTYFEAAKHALWVGVWKREVDPPFVVAEASLRYASPARVGDPLEIDISVSEIRTKAWVFAFAIRDARDGRLVADGKTVQVMYDAVARTPLAIPADVRALLESVRR
jgi:acyl-CoA thioester hydrolase